MARQGSGKITAPRLAEYRVGLKDLPESVRPRERLKHAGPGALSNAELLAIILRTGGRSGNVLDLANRLLAVFANLPIGLPYSASFRVGTLLPSPNPPIFPSPFSLAREVVSSYANKYSSPTT